MANLVSEIKDAFSLQILELLQICIKSGVILKGLRFSSMFDKKSWIHNGNN